jgi:uncharacterized protein (TIGR00645 family)
MLATPARLERTLSTVLHISRWVMAPFCFGLVAALAIIVIAFFRELIHDAAGFGTVGNGEVLLAALKLIDLLLVGNLVLLMIFAGATIVIGRAAPADWVGKADLSELRFRFVASIVAIAAVKLLESFVNVDAVDRQIVIWQIIILLIFVLSGVALAWMDRLSRS